MNVIRKILFLISACAMMAIALPASAQQKIFSLNMAGSVPAGSSAVVTATFKNETPNGNSSFNSLTLTAPAGLTIVSVASPPSGTAAFVTPGKTIKVTNMSPVGNGQTFVLSLTVSAAGTGSCTSTSGNWSATPWSGSQLSGNTFAIVPAKSSLATSVTASCSISFTTNPADALKGQVLSDTAYTAPGTPVKVKVLYGGSAPSPAATVMLTGACTPGGMMTLANSSATTDGSGVATFNTLSSSTAGTGCALTAKVSAVPSLEATSSSFKVVNPTLAFADVPTSVAPDLPVSFTVKLLDGGGNVIPAGGSGYVTVVVQPGSTCTLGPTSQNTIDGVLSFTSIVFGGTAGACELLATASFGGVTYTAKSGSFGVYATGELDCGINNNPTFPDWTATLPDNAFDGSPGIDTETTVKFYKGVRGANVLTYSDSNKNKPCVLLNYTLVNNVPGTGPDTTTQPGKTVPENAFALFYDDVGQPNATFRTLQTYRDEWTNSSGGIVKRTKVCIDSACSTQVNLKICLGTTLDPASMPNFDAPQDTSKKMPACLASEFVQAVPWGSCGAPEARPTNASCLRATSEMILVGDPVVPRSP